jgi:dihydroceramidase
MSSINTAANVHNNINADVAWRAAPWEDFEHHNSKSSIWGPVSATLDWCEENKFHYWIAEWYNTWTNFTMVILGFYGLYRGYKLGLETRILVGALGLAIVGIGSVAFHATLNYQAQLADEIPMLFTDAAFIYMITPKTWRKTPEQRWILTMALLFVTILISLVYTLTRDVLVHQVSFGFGAVIIFGKCASWGYHNRHHKKAQLATRLIMLGSFFMAFAFFIWNIDNTYCRQLRALRQKVGPLFEFIFQFHALWHVLNGFAVYLLGIFAAVHDDLEIGAKKQTYDIGFNSIGLPIVVPVVVVGNAKNGIHNKNGTNKRYHQ